MLNFLFTIACIGMEYSDCNTFEEVIAYETSIIDKIAENEYELLTDAYLSRGESYLLSSRYQEAILDLSTGYALALSCTSDQQPVLMLRALFCLAIVYGNLDMYEKVYELSNHIKIMLESFNCMLCKNQNQQPINQKLRHFLHSPKSFDQVISGFDRQSLSLAYHQSTNSAPYITQVNQPILGPSRISITECVDRVNGVQNAAKLLIIKARGEIQYMLHMLIDDLSDKARFCCRKGGIWKECLQPIINKWHIWNEKWQIFGIPPDPSWD